MARKVTFEEYQMCIFFDIVLLSVTDFLMEGEGEKLWYVTSPVLHELFKYELAQLVPMCYIKVGHLS